ncbi:MAG TPA: MCE family protein [bacterium]|nr:MCE family protein [bacterium]
MHRVRYLIGLLTLIGAIVGAWWIVRLLKSADERPGLIISVEFKNARGLRAGTDVRYRGVTVGTVRSVAITGDGQKAVARLLVEPIGAEHACVNSTFWIVRPRFSGITAGATGLDTLVRDSYVAFHTPAERGSRLTSGSLIAGSERPPLGAEPETLDDVEHGDLLMTLLVPENHGLKPGSAVIFRGMKTGDVRSVTLAPAGTHVEVRLRIARAYRQTVTDQTKFWVARPYVSGALFRGFTITDVSALLTPYISYYGEPGEGVIVQDGYRTAAEPDRPEQAAPTVPQDALQQSAGKRPPAGDGVVLVRVTYAAIERDTFSADDEILRHGTGVLFLDKAGRTVVVTARSLVDGSYTEHDLWGDPEIADERIKVLLADGSVLRAGRVWVDPDQGDLAALVLEDARPDLTGTPSRRLVFEGETPATGEGLLRLAGPDGLAADQEIAADRLANDVDWLGGAFVVDGKVVAIYALGSELAAPRLVALDSLPADLRPR